MKALAKTKDEPGLWLIDAPKPVPQAHEVRIKVTHTAICGTDIHIYQWNEWAQKTIPQGLITGHEFVGVVESCGEAVVQFQPGMRVSAEGHIPCWHCDVCSQGNAHLCPNMSWTGVTDRGTFAEYVVMPERNVIAIPDALSSSVAAILDPLGNAVHTALHFDCTAQNVLITGAGPIGLMAALVAKQVGAQSVCLSEVSQTRIDMALQLGLDAVHPKDLPDIDFQVGLELSGHPEALITQLERLQPGGKIALLGTLPDAAIPWDKIIFKGLTLQGIFGRRLFQTWRQMLRLIIQGMDVSPLITHHFPVADFEKAFETACQGQAGKVILTW